MIRQATREEIDFFNEYRANHVALVQKLGKLCFDMDFSTHDKDKIEASKEELNTYAIRQSRNRKNLNLTQEEENEIIELANKHMLNSPHHPEHWDSLASVKNIKNDQIDGHRMPDESLKEMVCDWVACALFRQEPIFDWYNKKCVGDNPKYKFTDEQKEKIIEYLTQLKKVIKEEYITYPGRRYHPKQVKPIREKILKKGNKWQVTDHTGTKNLGIYDTKEEAEKRLKQVEYFKNVKESLDDNLFLNSKVIDENGNLKVVYHGSPYKFDKFERAYSNGHYFMDNKEFASHIYPDIKYLYSAYLNLENPFIIDVCGASWENLLENIPLNPDLTQQELLSKYYEKYSEEGLMIDDLCQELLDEGKYDGIIAKNIKEGPPGNKQYIVTDYVAFNNNQIKILNDKLEEDEVKIETGKEDKNQIAIFADRVANPDITLTDSTVLVEDTSKTFLSNVYKTIKEKEGSWWDKAEQEIDFLNSCDYGIIIDDKKIIDSDKINKIFSSKEGEKFRTLTPKQVKENRVFVCWDAVNYLKSQIPELDEYFIEINNNKTDDCESSHSFCLYEDKDKVYWVEGSWGDFVGIHKFDSKEEAFNKISKEFLKDNGKLKKDENCRIFKFDTYGDKQLDTHQYILNARNGKIVWEYNKELKESIDITRSDNFKKWFGNSKVVDKAGNPLVVYHGSPDARFDVFVSSLEHPLYLGEDKPAYWFTDSYSMAKSYADDTRAFDYQNAIAGVKEVYLKIENPLIIDNLHREWHQTDKSGSSQDFVTKAYNDGYDGIIINNVKDYYYNNRNKSSGTTYVVFNKNQIKSIDNNGNFNPNSDKITESAYHKPLINRPHTIEDVKNLYTDIDARHKFLDECKGDENNNIVWKDLASEFNMDNLSYKDFRDYLRTTLDDYKYYDDPIIIKRLIITKPDEKLDSNHLGHCWAETDRGILNYKQNTSLSTKEWSATDGFIYNYYIASTSLNNVDWIVYTLNRSMGYGNEEEIRVWDDSKIKILSENHFTSDEFKDRENKIDWNNIKYPKRTPMAESLTFEKFKKLCEISDPRLFLWEFFTKPVDDKWLDNYLDDNQFYEYRDSNSLTKFYYDSSKSITKEDTEKLNRIKKELISLGESNNNRDSINWVATLFQRIYGKDNVIMKTELSEKRVYSDRITEGTQSTQYHYWENKIPYDDLVKMLDNPRQLYETFFEKDEGVPYEKYSQCDNYIKSAKEVLDLGKSDKINLYRTIAILPNKKLDEDDLGVCWAWDIEGAEYFANTGLQNDLYDKQLIDIDGNNPKVELVRINATTDRDNIDWAESIYLHSKYYREHELRIYNPRNVEVKNIIPLDRLDPYGQMKESKEDNFKKWFGNSKAVDKDGNPLVLYHGSYKKFKSFKVNKETGVYFTNDKTFAEDIGICYSCYLKMKNPLIIDAKENYWDNVYGAENDKDWISTENICESAKYQGYDSVIIYNVYEGDDGGCLTNDYVVFSSNQIKSIDNNGDFSINSDKITEGQEQIYTTKFKNWFGDWQTDLQNASKVVDGEGKPLVVYHGSGTDSVLEILDPTKGHIINAIYHSSSKEVAAHWGGTCTITRFNNNLKNILSKITNPKDLIKFTKDELDIKIKLDKPNETTIEDVKKYHLDSNSIGKYYPYTIIYPSNIVSSWGGSRSEEERLEKIKQEILEEIKDTSCSTSGHVYANYLNIRSPLIVDANNSPYWKINFEGQEVSTETIVEIAKNRGNDGVIIYNVYETDYENKLTDDYIVFNSNQIKSATDNNGNFNPNSNKITESIDITQSENFKRWFGNSKVVDENGKPIVVYHGTRKAGFDEFKYDPNNLTGDNFGETYFFTSSKKVALGYAYNIKNDPRYTEIEKERNRLASIVIDNPTEENKQNFLNRKRCSDLFDTPYITEGSEIKEVYLRIERPYIIQGYEKNFREVYPKNIERFKKWGNDGVIIYNVQDNAHGEDISDIYIVFSPNQIKSATDNNGNFDLNSDKITESEEDIEELDKWVKTWLRDTSKPIDKLLAPNGKESNLNKEQWITVRTPQFKKWFGDWEKDPQNSSKVMDNNGEPKIVYHGTKEKFDMFKTDNGVFFTDKLNVADTYSDLEPMSCFINIRNPYIVDCEGNDWNYLKDNNGKTTKDITNIILKSDEYDGIIFKNVVDVGKGTAKHGTPFCWNSNVYVVKNPNQIKSAYNNSGEFSMESDRITERNTNYREEDLKVGDVLIAKHPDYFGNKMEYPNMDVSALEGDGIYNSSLYIPKGSRVIIRKVLAFEEYIIDIFSPLGTLKNVAKMVLSPEDYILQTTSITERKSNTGLSPVPNDFIIIQSEKFRKDAKNLEFTDEDIKELEQAVKLRAPRASEGASLYKFDFWPKRFNKSPSEGRVIYYKKISDKKVVLMRAYHKSKESQLSTNDYKNIKKEINKY